MARTPWEPNHENMFETGIIRANEFNGSTRPGGIIGISFRFSLVGRYAVCSHKNRLIEAILMSTHNVQF